MIAICKDRVLTDAEIETDWNTGTGTTHPDVPLEKLAAYWKMDTFDATGPKTVTDLIGSANLTSDSAGANVDDAGIIGQCLSLHYDEGGFSGTADSLDLGD